MGPGSFFGHYSFLFGEFSYTEFSSCTECVILSLSGDDFQYLNVPNQIRGFSCLYANLSNSLLRHIHSRFNQLAANTNQSDFTAVKNPRLGNTLILE